jgi:hypothetical protein
MIGHLTLVSRIPRPFDGGVPRQRLGSPVGTGFSISSEKALRREFDHAYSATARPTHHRLERIHQAHLNRVRLPKVDARPCGRGDLIILTLSRNQGPKVAISEVTVGNHGTRMPVRADIEHLKAVFQALPFSN